MGWNARLRLLDRVNAALRHISTAREDVDRINEERAAAELALARANERLTEARLSMARTYAEIREAKRDLESVRLRAEQDEVWRRARARALEWHEEGAEQGPSRLAEAAAEAHPRFAPPRALKAVS
jgi:hypothetical protein